MSLVTCTLVLKTTSTLRAPLEGRSTGMGPRPGPGPTSRGTHTALFRIYPTLIQMEYFSIGSLPSLSPLHLATMGSLLHTNVVATIQRPCITVTRPGFCKTGRLYPWLPTLPSMGLFPQNITAEGFLLIIIISERLNTVIQWSLSMNAVETVECCRRSDLSHVRPARQSDGVCVCVFVWLFVCLGWASQYLRLIAQDSKVPRSFLPLFRGIGTSFLYNRDS